MKVCLEAFCQECAFKYTSRKIKFTTYRGYLVTELSCFYKQDNLVYEHKCNIFQTMKLNICCVYINLPERKLIFVKRKIDEVNRK